MTEKAHTDKNKEIDWDAESAHTAHDLNSVPCCFWNGFFSFKGYFDVNAHLHLKVGKGHLMEGWLVGSVCDVRVVRWGRDGGQANGNINHVGGRDKTGLRVTPWDALTTHTNHAWPRPSPCRVSHHQTRRNQAKLTQTKTTINGDMLIGIGN